MKSNSIRFEISVLYTFILGAIFFVFSGVLFIIFNGLNAELDHELILKGRAIHQTIDAYLDILGEAPDALKIATEKTISLKKENPLKIKSSRISQQWLKRSEELDLKEDYIHFVSSDGKTVSKSNNLSDELLPVFLKNAIYPKNREALFKEVAFNKQIIRLVNYPYEDKSGNSFLIQIGQEQERLSRLLQNWFYAMAISIPLILILTSFIGRILAARILDPVQEITETAQRITHQDLSLRVKSKHRDEEMEYLTESFNEMITRLERSFGHIEQFSVHVAHELKTPLTIIRGECELALKKAREQGEYQRVIQVTLEESNRMLKIVEDLLLLAKLDYQPDIFQFKEINFSVFFQEFCEQAKILVEPKKIQLHFEEEISKKPILIKADEVHLRRLFINIVDNAIKFTPANGSINLKVKVENKKIIVNISDTGPGISAEELPKIFEKFFRGNHRMSGSGLGLHMAQSIARIHGGSINVESKHSHGTTFKILLPLIG